jgi:hypothetical protein
MGLVKIVFKMIFFNNKIRGITLKFSKRFEFISFSKEYCGSFTFEPCFFYS